MRIRLLGRLQAETGEQAILRFETKNAALILLKLGLQPDRSVHRDELAELLWPEDFLDATRVRLRQELARLRRALGSAQSLIESDRERVWLTRPGVSTDLEQVTTMLRELPDSWAERLASLEQIVAMWDGPLAEGMNEVWVVRERHRWNSLHARTLGQLALSRTQFGQTS